MEYLTELFHTGLSYSGLNTARSALSSVININDKLPCGEHPLIKRLMKGFFNARPTFPRYNYTWDPETVLLFLDKWSPPQDLSRKDFTLKLVMMIALITGQRCQTIHCMDLSCMQEYEDRFRFVIEESIKTTKPGSKQPVLVLPKCINNPERCV